MTYTILKLNDIFEFPQKKDQQKMNPTWLYFQGLCSLKLFTVGLGGFQTRKGSKRPRIGPKMPWFGMV